MKWLIISDDEELTGRLNTFLSENNKKDKIYIAPITIETLKNYKKDFMELAACIIYTKSENGIEAAVGAGLCSMFGYFAALNIPVITNNSFLIQDYLFGKEIGIGCQSSEDLYNLFTENYSKLSTESCQRIAKKKLLNRGIPFTSDCFGTYIAKNKPEIVQEFLEAGMSINSRDDTGTPMLNIACRNDNYEFVEMMLGLGADINAVSEDRGYTAVMDAVWRGNEKITKYLISKGADLNTINKEGQNNLILAVGANRESLVKLLAENGANPDVKDMMGMSAYNYAMLFKKQRLVEILTPYHKPAD